MTVEPTALAQRARDRAVSDYAELKALIQQTGLFRRRYGYYGIRLALAVLAVAGTAVGIVAVGDSWWQMAIAAWLAVLMTQISFLGHDAAHRQIFTSGKANDWASLVVANLLAGLSFGWWQHKHTRHHANPNKDGADPDIDLTVLAQTAEQAAARRTPVSRWFVRRQGWFFFPLLLLEGISLHVASVRRAFGAEPVKRRWAEIAFLIVRLGGFVTLLLLVMSPVKAAVFLGVQLALFGLYMGSSFAPNHIGMPIVPRDMSIDFVRRQVLMSRNISGGRWMDVFMGGLNYQVEHHLFPSMPRPHLRRIAPIVREFCRERGIDYTQTSLGQSYRVVVRHLNDVGLAARDTFRCPLASQLRS